MNNHTDFELDAAFDDGLNTGQYRTTPVYQNIGFTQPPNDTDSTLHQSWCSFTLSHRPAPAHRSANLAFGQRPYLALIRFDIAPWSSHIVLLRFAWLTNKDVTPVYQNIGFTQPPNDAQKVERTHSSGNDFNHPPTTSSTYVNIQAFYNAVQEAAAAATSTVNTTTITSCRSLSS